MNGKHGITQYRNGCRCAVCTESARRAKQRQRAAKAKPHMLPESLRPAPAPAESAPNVVAMPKATSPVEAAAMGDNEAGVRAQCAASRLAADRPGTVAQCITLSKILDNAELAAMWPTTSRQLQSLLATLDGPRKKTHGSQLAVVSKMAGRRAL